VECLRALAREDGVTVVTVIHQPRGSIFGMLDDLILVAEGRTVYAGPADAAARYMESQVRQPGR
jgi:ABC-type multidrug transport system ATPase subunit